MNHDFKTCTFNLRSGSREIEVDQLLLYVVEVNKEMEAATGVDLIGAAASGIDSVGAVKIARSLGLSGRAYIKSYNNKSYLILKGNPGQRAVLQGTRYLASNPVVAHITISPKSLAAGAARMTSLAVVAYAGIRVTEAILSDEDVRLTHLVGTIASDLTKFAIAAGAGYLAGATFGAISTIAAGPVVVAILVGIATSIVLSRIDREFGLSEKMALALEKAVEKSRSPFDALAREIRNWERGFIQNALTKSIR